MTFRADSQIGEGAETVEQSVSEYRRKLRRDQLLSTAAKILSEEGADAVRIPRVANLAGVTRPSVYKHFANRQELLLGILQGLDDGLVDILDSILANGWGDPNVELNSVVEAIFDCVARWGSGAWNLLHSGGPDPETRVLSRQILNKFLVPAQQHLNKITGAKEARTGIYCELLVAVFDTGVSLWLDGRVSRSEAVETIHDSCIALIIALSNSAPGTLSSQSLIEIIATRRRGAE